MLTEKQKRFVDYYVSTGNATEAAREAGYKHPNRQGPRMLSNVGIQNATEARLKELESSRIADAKEVMEFLTKAMRGEMTEKVLQPLNIKGGGQKADLFNVPIGAKERLKAAELLTKRYGLQQPAEDTDAGDKIEFIFERGDDHED